MSAERVDARRQSVWCISVGGVVDEPEALASDTAMQTHEPACGRSWHGSAQGISEPGPCPEVGISRHESLTSSPA